MTDEERNSLLRGGTAVIPRRWEWVVGLRCLPLKPPRGWKRTLQKKVDLTTPDGLSKFIREVVLREAEIIYVSRIDKPRIYTYLC